MPSCGVDCRKGVHAIPYDIHGLVSLFPTRTAITVNIIINTYLYPFYRGFLMLKQLFFNTYLYIVLTPFLYGVYFF